MRYLEWAMRSWDGRQAQTYMGSCESEGQSWLCARGFPAPVQCPGGKAGSTWLPFWSRFWATRQVSAFLKEWSLHPRRWGNHLSEMWSFTWISSISVYETCVYICVIFFCQTLGKNNHPQILVNSQVQRAIHSSLPVWLTKWVPMKFIG